jgi:hypothetical protein
MGCWNNTCGLTNLPIISGESVYVFPIREKDLSNYRSHCYASALYQPALTPFVAEYNDYGAGENCSGIALEFIVEELRRELVEMEMGENQYHDIAIVRDEFDIDKFFEAVHEARLLSRGWGTTDRPVFFTMVRKDVADRMWNEWTFDQWKGTNGVVPEGFESDQYYLKNVTYAKLATLVPGYLNEVSASIKEMSSDKLMQNRYFSKSMLITDGPLEGIMRCFENFEFWDLLNGCECIIKYVINGELETAAEFIRNFMMGVMINSMMESTRKIWLPVMHQGSQSEEYSDYRFLNTLVNDVMDARQSEFEEDAEDDLFSTVGIYLEKDKIHDYGKA